MATLYKAAIERLLAAVDIDEVEIESNWDDGSGNGESGIQYLKNNRMAETYNIREQKDINLRITID